MDALIQTLYSSKHYSITDFKCQCLECSKSKSEYQDSFSLSFVRKGNFYFNVFKNSLDAYSGSILVNKPGYEYTVSHVEDKPDECTILTFKDGFYENVKEEFEQHASWFASKDSIQSVLLNSGPDLDCLHSILIQKIKQVEVSRLEIESLIVEIFQRVLDQMGGDLKRTVSASQKKYHLKTVEQAKEYIQSNFTKNISLFEMADHCHISPFHFSRLFKTFTQYSPNQYLQVLRLQHAEWLLKTSNQPVTEIAFDTGFNSIDYFSAAFKHKYKIAPSIYRAQKAG